MRDADVYLFCLLPHMDKESIDPVNRLMIVTIINA